MSDTRAPSPAQIAALRRALSEAGKNLLAIDPAMPEHDPQLWADMLEGECDGDPFAMLDRLIRGALESEAYVEALQQRQADLAVRAERYARDVERRRKLAQDILEETQIKTLTRPEYTASLAAGKPRLIATVPPGKLPPRFQRVTIEADKPALARALKAGETDVPATWSNAPPVLQIRTR